MRHNIMHKINHALCAFLLAGMLLPSCAPAASQPPSRNGQVRISKDVLLDKIRGGWAGKTIGCTYGGPTEFKHRGSLMHDYQKIEWHDDYIAECMAKKPGLYDDVYMNLIFMDVIEREGPDAPAESFGNRFAHADCRLWHANQTARYNILRGIKPPLSGHWKNSPHAEDIGFQIEADFIGLMSPGMPNASSDFCDKVGHIMTHGDGWYGGVFVAAMHSLAFIANDVEFIVTGALKTIPAQSNFYHCIADVIRWHKQYPGDWKQCWFEVEKKYASEKGCPDGVFKDFNISATINAAYVVIGLLYGNGDFGKTMEIATRCGQDSDCNPATAAGILGVMLGYGKIPDAWKIAYEKVEDTKFPFIETTLRRACAVSAGHAVQMVVRNGGRSDAGNIYIAIQQPAPVRFEECFEGLTPSTRKVINKEHLSQPVEIEFTGRAVVLTGSVRQLNKSAPAHVARLAAYLDGRLVDEFDMPSDFIKRKFDIYYNYDIPAGRHKLVIKWLNPDKGYRIHARDLLAYE
jgi:hypothetical protein